MASDVIRLSDVQFRWRPQDPLTLDIPLLEVAAGERLFITGASGSGKTTLLNLLGGFSVPESGEVRVLGQDIARIPGGRRDAFRADHVGFIFQMFNLVPFLSMVENVLLPCRFSERRRRRAADGIPLETAAERLLSHMGLDVSRLADRTVSELSVGQQQRVAASRALIGAPGMIIADEPTSSLDADTQTAFLELLFTEASQAGTSVVFVSHDHRLEPSFDRTVAIADINRVGAPSP